MKTVIFCLFLIVVSLVLLACSSPASIEEGTPTDVFIDTDTAPPPTPLDDTDNDGDGYSEQEGDCDDSSPTKNPQAPEVCNGVDDDCDASIDDGLLTTWYVDSDKDGYGDSGGTAQACSEPFGYSSTPGDCDDNSPSSCPECVEVCDGEDNNCDGVVDESPDQDLDGYGSCVDCDDKDLFVHPGIPEACDAKDNDCDGQADEDFDLDKDGWPSCDDGIHFPDCDDTNPTTHPGAPEICSDGINNDCRGSDAGIPADSDLDGAVACFYSEGLQCVENCSDCDDHNQYVHPYSEYGGSIDNDCNGLKP